MKPILALSGGVLFLVAIPANVTLWLAVILTALITALLAGWAALIVQSLVGRGDLEPYFTAELDWHCPPENDEVMILDATFGFVDSRGDLYEVEKGMETDGASIGSVLPYLLVGWLARWALGGTPFTGPFRPAAVVHDGPYRRAQDRRLWRALISAKRATADRLIQEAATCRRYVIGGREIARQPAPLWRATIVMAVLRLAGAFAWRDNARGGA